MKIEDILEKKYLSINNEIFLIEDMILQDHCNLYTVKSNVCITKRTPVFKFKNEVYYSFGIGDIIRSTYLDEVEFNLKINEQTKDIWTTLVQTDKVNNNNAFALSSKEISSRSAFTSLFGKDTFDEYVTGLYKETEI